MFDQMCFWILLHCLLSAVHANEGTCHSCVCAFHCRVRRDRKGQSDRIADCQNWQDLNSENAMNEIDAFESSVEVVDGREKVQMQLFNCTLLTHLSRVKD